LLLKRVCSRKWRWGPTGWLGSALQRPRGGLAGSFGQSHLPPRAKRSVRKMKSAQTLTVLLQGRLVVQKSLVCPMNSVVQRHWFWGSRGRWSVQSRRQMQSRFARRQLRTQMENQMCSVVSQPREMLFDFPRILQRHYWATLEKGESQGQRETMERG